jgi:prepilin-type N-terminal cleavage/methylation domain-containing protein/prepilin-type processing-associated H-X9-DG protein
MYRRTELEGFHSVNVRAQRARNGFTLLELLIVIAVISILFSMLILVTRNAMASVKSARSMSNLRQWGLAAKMYVNDHDQKFPWDGVDDVAACIDTPDWWANALPPYVGYESYRDLVHNGEPPIPPKKTIFLDPSAKVPPNAPYESGNVEFFFCYVPNSKLNSSIPGNQRVRVSRIARPAATAFIVEMRTHRDELPPSSPFYRKTLDRAKADWQRFANRHKEGGHIVFVDGHVEHVTQKKATTSTGGDYNQGDLIWNPFGEAR